MQIIVKLCKNIQLMRISTLPSALFTKREKTFKVNVRIYLHVNNTCSYTEGHSKMETKGC